MSSWISVLPGTRCLLSPPSWSCVADCRWWWWSRTTTNSTLVHQSLPFLQKKKKKKKKKEIKDKYRGVIHPSPLFSSSPLLLCSTQLPSHIWRTKEEEEEEEEEEEDTLPSYVWGSEEVKRSKCVVEGLGPWSDVVGYHQCSLYLYCSVRRDKERRKETTEG